MDEPDGGRDYGFNAGRWIQDHPKWLVFGAPGGFGFTAFRRGTNGKPVGRVVEGRTLDELAAGCAERDKAERGQAASS